MRVCVCGSPSCSVVHLVERVEAIERRAAHVARHARRIVDVQNRIAGGAEAHARVLAGQKPARPQPRGDRLHLLGVRRLCATITTNVGRSSFSEPRPYEAHDPRQGRPVTWLPVCMNVIAGS